MTFQYKTPTPAYKKMRELNKSKGGYKVVQQGTLFVVVKGSGQLKTGKKGTGGFDIKNTSTIHGGRNKDKAKLDRRKAFLKESSKSSMSEFRKSELKKIARAKLIRGEAIKSEKREKLKKGK